MNFVHVFVQSRVQLSRLMRIEVGNLLEKYRTKDFLP